MGFCVTVLLLFISQLKAPSQYCALNVYSTNRLEHTHAQAHSVKYTHKKPFSHGGKTVDGNW